MSFKRRNGAFLFLICRKFVYNKKVFIYLLLLTCMKGCDSVMVYACTNTLSHYNRWYVIWKAPFYVAAQMKKADKRG